MKKLTALVISLFVSTSFAANNNLIHEAHSVKQLPDKTIILSEMSPAQFGLLKKNVSEQQKVINKLETKLHKVALAKKINRHDISKVESKLHSLALAKKAHHPQFAYITSAFF